MNIAFDESKVLNRLRVIATLLVVIGHATRMFTAQGVYHDSIQENLILTKITGIIYSFHMPLFFLISGYVYGICLNKGGVYNSFLPFIKKKSQRLLLPYYFWGILYVAPIMVCLSITTLPYHTFVYQGIVLGLNCRHLWFLFTLFEIFVVVHVLVLTSKKFGFFLVAIPVLLSIAFVIRYIPNVPRTFQLASFCDYSFYFVCGLAIYAIKGIRNQVCVGD